jgi:hypothetical protein
MGDLNIFILHLFYLSSEIALAGFLFPVTGFEFTVTGFEFPVTGFEFPVTGFEFPVTAKEDEDVDHLY